MEFDFALVTQCLPLLIKGAGLTLQITALAVGIGLSVAGCVYQAIIRNPLVDPYIMGVSSGAGVRNPM